MALVTEELRAKAEIYHGNDICQEKFKFLFQEMGFPRGLLPLKELVECGYVEETGFVWLKQKSKSEHYFEKIGKNVTYAPEITAYVEKLKITKLTGVKSKELLIWVTVNEIHANGLADGKVVFKTPTGLSRSFPSTAFDEEKQEEEEEKKEEK
ncbi:hypothetical protein CKAN_02383600 [Cinnamomum micranthum f. kanehirae]|uniref:DUF538 domain-containing protein n=1 Tax=Cinnamomum micranthum f. kanehirae TaxID=337451 RepID=A0A443PUS5_9MAGN|nr:hypothetical protein CKAN_02383600 [Cinnamomum micranthum f. kanehirae]